MLYPSFDNPPDTETKPTDPGRYNFVSRMFSTVPAAFPILNDPGLIPPTVAGPITHFFFCLAILAIFLTSRCGTPSAIMMTVRMVLVSRASRVLSAQLLSDAKFTITSASGWALTASSTLV